MKLTLSGDLYSRCYCEISAPLSAAAAAMALLDLRAALPEFEVAGCISP